MTIGALLIVLVRCHRAASAHSFLERFGSTAISSSPSAWTTCASSAIRVARGGSFSAEDPVGFEILSENVIHDNWRKLSCRNVQLPSQKIADFEIVSQGDRGSRVTDEAVMVFVWNRSTQTATLIKEYMPSVHKLVLGLAAGMVEDKHDDSDECDASRTTDPVYTAGVHELEEECRLKGGTWYRLCEPTVMDKYSTTRISVYLVIDPIPVGEDGGKNRDDTEEGMQVITGVKVTDLEEILATGGMTVVGGWATQMALAKLRALGLIER